MVNLDNEIDWTACELIEQVPGKVWGRPVVRGTRILPDALSTATILGDSIEDIHEGFPSLSIEQIKAVDRVRSMRYLVDMRHVAHYSAG